MSPEEKKSRILRQVAIFGTVLVGFLAYVGYRLATGNFG